VVERYQEQEEKQAERQLGAIKGEADKLTQLVESNTDLTRQDKELTEQVAKLTQEIHQLLLNKS
jgi:phage host-nuclease inhibitor protein Gam